MSEWNKKVEASIQKEKAEVEKQYNIIIGQTQIHCAKCGQSWPGCPHSLPVKQAYNYPRRTLDEYRKDLGIEVGMSKQEALEKFLVWQEDKRTCQRCEGEKLIEFCPFNLICKEAMEYDARRQVDIRSGSAEDTGGEEASISHDAKQFGFDFCESV